MNPMRKALIPVMLLALAACSSFESQRVRQAAHVIDELGVQAKILVENDRITAEQAEAVSAALKVALAETERYWNAVKNGAPRELRRRILDILNDAIQEATRILAQREQS